MAVILVHPSTPWHREFLPDGEVSLIRGMRARGYVDWVRPTTDSQAVEEAPRQSVSPKENEPQTPIELSGLPERTIALLLGSEYNTMESVLKASDEELRAIEGLGPQRLAQIRELLPAEG